MRGRWTAWLLVLMLGGAVPAAAERDSPDGTALAGPEEILALTPEMRRFVAARVPEGATPTDRLHALLDALFGKRGLGIRYGGHQTHSAAETFRAASGNCISFTHLFIALAREVGLAAYFAEVDDIVDREQRGDVVVNNKHMFAVVEIANGHFRVDFGPADEDAYRFVRRISDRRAAAHYQNNLGAERLVAGDLEGALAHLDRAAELDATLAAVWVNRGVAHRQAGDHEAAEEAYLEALELDGSELAARSNLALLYRRQGRLGEAERMRRAVEGYRSRNPFHLYSRGRQAVEGGALDEAVRLFTRAVRRAPEQAELHFALGDALYRAGRLERAAESLQRAVELVRDSERRLHYERALEAVGALLRSAGTPAPP